MTPERRREGEKSMSKLEKLATRAIEALEKTEIPAPESAGAGELPSAPEALKNETRARVSEGMEVDEAQRRFREIKRWLDGKEINPNYNPFRFTPYSVNCGSCAFALWSRITGKNPEAVASAKNIAPHDRDMERLTQLKVRYMSPKDIETILRARGPGSHLIVGINRTTGSGHWFNAFFDGKEVRTLDAQSGKVYEWPHDYGRVSAWCALV